jgi:hypothetical protein
MKHERVGWRRNERRVGGTDIVFWGGDLFAKTVMLEKLFGL